MNQTKLNGSTQCISSKVSKVTKNKVTISMLDIAFRRFLKCLNDKLPIGQPDGYEVGSRSSTESTQGRSYTANSNAATSKLVNLDRLRIRLSVS
jgi:hypothetical protein